MTHGTRATYLRGCHCDDCLTAHRRYVKAYKHRTGANPHTGIPMRPLRTDAAPVAEHLNALVVSGWVMADIARETGVSESTVYDIRQLRHGRVRLATADALLALVPLEVVDVDDVVVARLCIDPGSWRTSLRATRRERIEAGRLLGASSWQPLGLNGREFRDTTPRRHSEGIAS